MQVKRARQASYFRTDQHSGRRHSCAHSNLEGVGVEHNGVAAAGNNAVWTARHHVTTGLPSGGNGVFAPIAVSPTLTKA